MPRAVALYETLEQGKDLRLPLEVPSRAEPGFGGVDIGLSTMLLLPLVDVIRSLCLDPVPWPDGTAARVLDSPRWTEPSTTWSAPDLPSPEALRQGVETDLERLQGWLRPYQYGGSSPVWESGCSSGPRGRGTVAMT